MPTYEYRCRACGSTFEEARTMANASAPAMCPSGHADTVKMLSTVAITGRAGSSPSAAPSGGGCCGGSCGCGHA